MKHRVELPGEVSIIAEHFPSLLYSSRDGGAFWSPFVPGTLRILTDVFFSLIGPGGGAAECHAR